MAAINGNIITVIGAESALVPEDLPKGTLFMVTSKSCSAGAELSIKNGSGVVFFTSFAEGANLWRDKFVLPCDLRGGFTVPTFEGTTRTLIIIKPSGRIS